MATSEKTMREFLFTAQKWQRRAALKSIADVEVATSHFNGKTNLRVSAYLRNENDELAKDENGELICKIAIMYYYDDENTCRAAFEEVGKFLTDNKAV